MAFSRLFVVLLSALVLFGLEVGGLFPFSTLALHCVPLLSLSLFFWVLVD